MNYSGQIELTKLQCAIIEKKGKTGMIRGVFIPIENNYLDEFQEGRVALPINVHVNDQPDKYGNDGFIGQKVSTKVYKEASDEQKEKFKQLPILGNFKNFSGNNSDSKPADTYTDEQDLPF